MKIIFLGTNGWYDTETGNTICVFIETKKEYIVLDAGNGIHKIDRYIKKPKPVYLFLSHFHLDHIAGLHCLAKFNFRQGITVYGPAGVKRVFSDLMRQPYTVPLRRLKTRIKVEELREGVRLPLKCDFKRLRHSSFCYGYCFQLEGKSIAFCTDTGVCPNLYRLSRNVDLLIAECSWKAGHGDKSWPHLNPYSVARLAKESGAKRLILVHFDSALYLKIADRKTAERQARGIFKHSLAATDGLNLVI